MYNRIWIVYPEIKGFKVAIFVEGTEDEVRDYMESEFGYMPAYTGATNDEIASAKKLRLPIYIA